MHLLLASVDSCDLVESCIGQAECHHSFLVSTLNLMMFCARARNHSHNMSGRSRKPPEQGRLTKHIYAHLNLDSLVQSLHPSCGHAVLLSRVLNVAECLLLPVQVLSSLRQCTMSLMSGCQLSR